MGQPKKSRKKSRKRRIRRAIISAQLIAATTVDVVEVIHLIRH
jgi:hypothetical protein